MRLAVLDLVSKNILILGLSKFTPFLLLVMEVLCSQIHAIFYMNGKRDSYATFMIMFCGPLLRFIHANIVLDSLSFFLKEIQYPCL